MIDVNQDYNVVRTLFLAECAKREIPTNNKAAALYTMAERLADDPENDELRDLLFLTLADEELLISQFGGYNSYEVEETFQDIQQNYKKLWETYKEQADLEDSFSDYEALPIEITLGGESSGQKPVELSDEALNVAELTCTCLELNDEVKDVLLENLGTLLCEIHKDLFLERCKPLIIFLAISRFEKEFVQTSKFQLRIKDLFTCIDYPISDAGKKKRKKYKALTKFYRKLCKLYKGDVNVDKKQCRYGFFATSNLVDFVVNEQFDKCKMHCPPFLYTLLFMDMSCMESEQPDKWSDEELFDLTENKQEQYYDLEETEEYSDEMVDWQVATYLEAHPDVLLHLMYAIYQDEAEVVRLVSDVCQSCVKKAAEKYADFEGAIKAEVYFEMRQILDQMVEEKVIQTCMM